MDIDNLSKLLLSGSLLTSVVTIGFKVVTKLYNDMRTDHTDLMNFLITQNEINTKVSISLSNLFNEICEVKNILTKKE
jgi:hypothetical protein